MQLPKRRVFSFLEYETMGKVQIPNNSEYKPTSEPFSIYLVITASSGSGGAWLESRLVQWLCCRKTFISFPLSHQAWGLLFTILPSRL